MDQRPSKEERQYKAKLNKLKKDVQKTKKQAEKCQAKADSLNAGPSIGHGTGYLLQGKAARLAVNARHNEKVCELLTK